MPIGDEGSRCTCLRITQCDWLSLPRVALQRPLIVSIGIGAPAQLKVQRLTTSINQRYIEKVEPKTIDVHALH